MGRKSTSVPSISFFSFQDIITSVTGIMFLVVILLVLIIIESNSVPAAAGSPARTVKTDLDALRKRFEALRESITDHRAWLAKNNQTVETLTKIDFSSIPAKIEMMQSELALLRTEREKIKAEVLRIERECTEIRGSETAQSEKVQNLSTDAEKREQEISEKKSELSKLQEEVAKRKQISIAISRDESKIPVLVECGKDGIRAKLQSSSEIHDFRTPDLIHFNKTVTQFLSWSNTLPSDQYYFVLCVAPAAFGYVGDLLVKLKEAGKERGVEVLPDDESEFL
jgi:hypothetical protein